MQSGGILYVVVLFFIKITYTAAADCQAPVYSITTDQQCTLLDGLVPPPDYLEGSTFYYSCKELLWRTKAAIDYCPVEVCQSDGSWRQAQLSCGSSECYNITSTAYMGRRTCTNTGKMCQRWNEQYPHNHTFTDPSAYPDENITLAGNYCRDPGGTQGIPWCFTNDPDPDQQPWQPCDIPSCDDVNIAQGQCHNNYCGDPETEITTDNSCVSVTVQGSYARFVDSVITYSCSSLLTGFNSTISYCPVRRCKSDFWWTNVTVSCGINECFSPGQSHMYTGKRKCTVSGWECQRWETQTPHNHTYTSDSQFPDNTVEDANAYCRDPDGSGEPWCFTTNPSIQWESCNIPLCSALPVNAGTCTVPTTTVSTTSISTPPTTLLSPTTSFPPGSPLADDLYVRMRPSLLGYTEHNRINLCSAVDCARECHVQNPCVMISYQTDGTCILYEQNGTNSDVIDCSSKKCYLVHSLAFP